MIAVQNIDCMRRGHRARDLANDVECLAERQKPLGMQPSAQTRALEKLMTR